MSEKNAIDQAVNVNCNARIIGKDAKNLIVETVEIDRKGNEYETQHVVELGKGMKSNGCQYVHIEGTIDTDDNGVNKITPMKFIPLEDRPETLNMNAWVTGMAANSFVEINDPTKDKKPFGIASVKLPNRFQRGVVFNQLITTFRNNLKSGAIVKLAGRLQYRTYEDKDGNERTIMEIVCDNEYTRIVKASMKKNPFAFSTDDAMESAGFKKAEVEL